MTKIDANIQTAQNMLSGIVERCYKLEKENKTLNASRDYWKDKAEKLIKENGYYKKKAKEYELALKIEYSDKPDLYKLIFGNEQL